MDATRDAVQDDAEGAVQDDAERAVQDAAPGGVQEQQAPSPEAVIETPSSDGVAQALEVARRWLPAFLAGRRADDELYAEGATTWHNIGEREVEIQCTPSRTRANQAGSDLRVVEPRVKVFDGGWVFQGTTVGTNPKGEQVRIPVCLVVQLRDGRIARFEEYADSRAAEALFATD